MGDNKKRILSGINPSSSKGLHLGNYFGAVKQQVEMQDDGECLYFVANLHALNSIFNPKEVEQNTTNVFIEWLALGLDPAKSIFYVQSDIQAIPYLQTIINNVLTVSELKRMHAYKDKLSDPEANPDSISFGLFTYPVLMASDILAFKSDIVPVGDDQTQHIEIARDIAKGFNNRYGEILTIPEIKLRKQGARVTGTDGERKMSKSLGNDITVFGTEKEVIKQIMGITTDPARIHPDDPGDPDKNVTFEYLELLGFNSKDLEEMKDKYRTGNIKDVDIKRKLQDQFFDYFSDFRKKKEELEKNLDYIFEVRRNGAFLANKIADEVLSKVKKAVGLTIKEPKNIKKGMISFNDFMKLDIRVGNIKSAEKVEGLDKILKLIISFGQEERQVMAGIAEYKQPEELVGKQIPVLFNLEPKVLRGYESQGMIMAVDDGEGIALLHPEKEVEGGSVVR